MYHVGPTSVPRAGGSYRPHLVPRAGGSYRWAGGSVGWVDLDPDLLAPYGCLDQDIFCAWIQTCCFISGVGSRSLMCMDPDLFCAWIQVSFVHGSRYVVSLQAPDPGLLGPDLFVHGSRSLFPTCRCRIQISLSYLQAPDPDLFFLLAGAGSRSLYPPCRCRIQISLSPLQAPDPRVPSGAGGCGGWGRPGHLLDCAGHRLPVAPGACVGRRGKGHPV